MPSHKRKRVEGKGDGVDGSDRMDDLSRTTVGENFMSRTHTSPHDADDVAGAKAYMRTPYTTSAKNGHIYIASTT